MMMERTGFRSGGASGAAAPDSRSLTAIVFINAVTMRSCGASRQGVPTSRMRSATNIRTTEAIARNG
jgi:hypothetical protein